MENRRKWNDEPSANPNVIEKENSVKANLRNALLTVACAAILLAPLSVWAQADNSKPTISQQPSTADRVDVSFFHNASNRDMRAEIKALLPPGELAAGPTCHSDGAACSDDSECCNSCKGGSCCMASGNKCTSSNHCCSHISCGSDGKCP